MSTYGVLERIDGPPPLVPMYGLLQAAEAPAAGVRLVPDTDASGIERWMNGVEVYPYPIDTGDIFDACAGSTDFADKGDGEAVPHPIFGAMTAYLAETCTTSKVWDQDEFIARATLALTAVESASIAREFMTGHRMPANPHLADGNGAFPIGDSATSVVRGLAFLENEIAKLSARFGLIHCSPAIATIMRERFTVDTKTGVLRTVNGNVVIPDAGYAVGSTPVGHVAPIGGQEWIYATGPIDIRRSEMFVMPPRVEQAVDRGSGGATNGKPNSITYRAERYYLVDWDTAVQAAVLVDICQDTCVS